MFTMYSGRFNLTMQVVAQVKKYYGNKVYKTVVPRTVRLSEAPSFGMPINFYEPNGKGSEAYMAMAREFWKITSGNDPGFLFGKGKCVNGKTQIGRPWQRAGQPV